MENTQRKQLIAEYVGGTAKYKLAQKYHCCKKTINKILNEATRRGEIAEGLVQSRDDRYYRSDKKVLESQVKYATVCDLWRKGYTYDEMKAETGMCFETLNKYVRKGWEVGDIPLGDSNERKKAVEKRKSLKCGHEFKKKERVYHKVKSTLNEGETIRCTNKVSRSCVYGRRTASEQGCRYSLVTGKCRTIGPNGEKVNPLCACTCYSRVSKTNPKLNNAVEE